MQRLAKDFERISDKLTSRECEIEKLSRERTTLAEQVAKYDKKKDEWRQQTKQLEGYFNDQLEGIRRGFDQQLRDLIENHRMETDMLEQALQNKQLKLDDKSNELHILKTRTDTANKFLKLNAEM